MWAEVDFRTGLEEFHGRNRTTLIRAAGRIFEHTGKSFSASLGVSLRQSVATILAKEQMNTQKMLAGHYQATITACAASATDLIVVAQDTTYYNMSSHKAMAGLGPLQGKLRGTLQHNVLAMDADGVPIGLLHQHNWTRQGLGTPELESDKWTTGLQKVNEAAAAIAKPILLVQDREADIFEFFTAPRAENVSVLVRIFQRRSLELPGDDDVLRHYRLDQALEALHSEGSMSVEIFRGGKPVTLRLSVRSAMVNVLAGYKKRAKTPKAENLRLVVATETGAMDGAGKDVFDSDNPAEWILLFATKDADCSLSAMEIVGFYALRWRIERLHYVQKSGGLYVERLQFDEVGTFFNALAFYSIIACRILRLTYALRRDEQQDAATFFSATELKVLEAASAGMRQTGQQQQRAPRLERLADAVRALARLEGFAPSKRQPFPGPKVLGAALVRLHNMVEGYNLASSFSLQD